MEGSVDISFFRYVSNNKYRLVKEFSVDQAQAITAMSAINSFFSCILAPYTIQMHYYTNSLIEHALNYISRSNKFKYLNS